MTRSDSVSGPGEAAGRARSRRMLFLFGGLGGTGFVTGLVAALVYKDDAPLWAGGIMPPWFAILAAVVMVAAVGLGSLRYHRQMDELQRRDNLIAGTVGANVLFGVYPVWLCCGKGASCRNPTIS